jgi:hypothetical protein
VTVKPVALPTTRRVRVPTITVTAYFWAQLAAFQSSRGLKVVTIELSVGETSAGGEGWRLQDGVRVGTRVGVRVRVRVRVGVRLAVAVEVGVRVSVGVCVTVGVPVWVPVAVGVRVSVGLPVGVFVGVFETVPGVYSAIRFTLVFPALQALLPQTRRNPPPTFITPAPAARAFTGDCVPKMSGDHVLPSHRLT